MASSFPLPFARVAAVVVAGGTLAAAGQAAYAGALPDLGAGANALRAGLASFATNPAPAPTPDVVEVAGQRVRAPLTPVAAAPPIGVVTGADVVAGALKAADLNQAAADAARRAAEAEVARQAAETARAQEAARQAAELAKLGATRTVAGGVQMVVGQVSSGFGTRGGAPHLGVDIAAPIGTPIHVPLAGTVIDSGPASGFGLWVRVRHADGTVTTYGHVNRTFVTVGQQVQAGEEIAEVGNRGQSSGPHLHFQVATPGGTTINPQPWLDQRGIGYT